MDIRKIKEGHQKYYLGKFYRENGIYQEIWNKVNAHKFDSNLIIRIPPNPEILASVVSSFWMQHSIKNKSIAEFYAIDLFGVAQARFDEIGNNEGISDIRYMMGAKQHLIVYEQGDPEHKLYIETLRAVFNERILNQKHNMLILSHRTPEELLDENLLQIFGKPLDWRDVKLQHGSKILTKSNEEY